MLFIFSMYEEKNFKTMLSFFVFSNLVFVKIIIGCSKEECAHAKIP